MFIFSHCARAVFTVLVCLMLASCAFNRANSDKKLFSRDVPKDQTELQLDVRFSRSPDYSPPQGDLVKQFASSNPRLEFSSFKKTPVLDLRFHMALTILPVPYWVPTMHIDWSFTDVRGEKLDDLNYRFVLPSRSGWHSTHSFALNYRTRVGHESITLAFSPDVRCERQFTAVTPIYGDTLTLSAQFPQGGGCLQVCDSATESSNTCAYRPKGTNLSIRP